MEPSKNPQSTLTTVGVVLATAFSILCAALLTSLPPAQAADPVLPQPFTIGSFTNLPSLIPAGATVTLTNDGVNVRPGIGIGIMAEFVATNANTSNVTFGFEASLDGTNWSTITPWSFTFPCNGTTAVKVFTNIPPAQLNNARKFKPSKVQSYGADGITLSRILYNFEN